MILWNVSGSITIGSRLKYGFLFPWESPLFKAYMKNEPHCQNRKATAYLGIHLHKSIKITLIVYQVRSSSEDSYPHVRPKVWCEADWISTDPTRLSDNRPEPDDNRLDQIIINQVQNKDVGWSG